jgi:hypothetical protein
VKHWSKRRIGYEFVITGTQDVHIAVRRQTKKLKMNWGLGGSKILVSLPYDILGYAELYSQPLCALRKPNINVAARVYVHVKW